MEKQSPKGIGIISIAVFVSKELWGPAEKVLRGGGWNNNWNNLRTANRNNNNPDNHNNNIGFRCVSSPIRFLKSQVQAFYGRLLSLREKYARQVPG